jgi:formate hydrogenlyase subunit 4
VALTGFVAILVLPVGGPWWMYDISFVALSFIVVLLLSGIAAATARFTLQRSIEFYWRWAMILAVLAISSAIYMRYRS